MAVSVFDILAVLDGLGFGTDEQGWAGEGAEDALAGLSREPLYHRPEAIRMYRIGYAFAVWRRNAERRLEAAATICRSEGSWP